jgi:hypothetical protein
MVTTTLAGEAMGAPSVLSEDGARVAQMTSSAPLETGIFDTKRGTLVATVEGRLVAFLPNDHDHAIVKDSVGTATALALVDLTNGVNVPLLGGSGIGNAYGDTEDVVVTPDGSYIAALTGDVVPDFCSYVGISVVDRSSLNVDAIEAPECTETIARRMQPTEDGQSLVYLVKGEGLLDIGSVNLATGERKTIVGGPELERGFVLGPGFSP